MAEARIDPEQFQRAVYASLKRALDTEPIIRRPILIGIIAWPNDNNQVGFEDIKAINVDANS